MLCKVKFVFEYCQNAKSIQNIQLNLSELINSVLFSVKGFFI